MGRPADSADRCLAIINFDQKATLLPVPFVIPPLRDCLKMRRPARTVPSPRGEGQVRAEFDEVLRGNDSTLKALLSSGYCPLCNIPLTRAPIASGHPSP